jgi:hypothetical protein
MIPLDRVPSFIRDGHGKKASRHNSQGKQNESEFSRDGVVLMLLTSF